MTLGILKLARFVVPAALIFVYAWLLGSITGLWETTLPDFSKSLYLPAVVVLAALYYITPLRNWVNGPHHRKIREGLRKGLVDISRYPDKPNVYTWEHLESLFYELVDQDTSLGNKATRAYMNGLLWTSFADATALGILFATASLGLLFFHIPNAFDAFVLFAVIAIVTLVGSFVTTREQMKVGRQQLELIRYNYREKIEKRLNQLDR